MIEPWDLADVSKIPDLFELGKKSVDMNFEMVRQHFLEHKRTQFTPFTSTSNETRFFDEHSFK